MDEITYLFMMYLSSQKSLKSSYKKGLVLTNRKTMIRILEVISTVEKGIEQIGEG